MKFFRIACGILLLLLAVSDISTAQGDVPGSGQTLYRIETKYLTPQTQPYFLSDDYALILKSDIPTGVSYTAVLPDQPGDYFIMRIKSADDLKPIEDDIPYVLFGKDAIFRTDAAGARILPRYGWGLTRLKAVPELEKIAGPPGPPIITEYDPDIAEMISDITPQSCEATLTDITSFPTRYSYSSYCRDAEQYVYDQFTALSLNTSFHTFSYGGTTMRNVIGEMVGTTRPDSIIIICGHLDDVSGNPYDNAPGAEDNGSGSTAVIEAARVLSQFQTDLTIRFITFSGEEQGLIGSDIYSQLMYDNGEDIGAVINLDMVAYKGPYAYDVHVFKDNLSQSLGDLAMETIGDYTSIIGIEEYSYNPHSGSDHYYFSLRGYPAIFFIDADPWNGGDDWYPHYHSIDDILDHLDMNFLADVSRTGAALAAILARVDFGIQEIPTLSEWGMLILGLLLLASGTIAIIRRKRPLPKTTD